MAAASFRSPDFESKSSYSVLVRTTDQDGLTFDKALTIGINNVNETPLLSTPAVINYSDTAFVDNFVTKTGFLVSNIGITECEEIEWRIQEAGLKGVK